ncbi:AmmeMemoRadiSam system protein B [Gemmata sp.]|uniref:AmmeMemoRadiSam system protein B n=1 Tax=Gemmata sp. TaxID=1914242 RepID=UPI003F72AEED
MPTDDRPRLRDNLGAEPHDDGNFVIYDPLRVGRPVVLSPLAAAIAQRFDGDATVPEIVAALNAQFANAEVSVEAVAGLVAALDDASLLDSPKLRARFEGPVRTPVCFDMDADPAPLRAQLTELFTAPGGAGMPEDRRGQPGGSKGKRDKLRAVLAPHMDYGRGNVTYGHAFAELIRHTDARVFVIVATSHYSGHRFTLTRQNFATPLGVVETDQDYVTRIVDHYGGGLFDDPFAHVPEHSIELEAVLLQFLLAGRRPFKIVPLLTGSLGDHVRKKSDPATGGDLSRMVAALRAAEAACSEPVCYLISGDLAHIGPKFGDKRKAEGPWLVESRERDAAILKALESASASAFFNEVAAEQDKRRICGLTPTWLTLELTKPRTGKVLHYQQFVHPQGKESVSFAAAAFYG